MSVSGLRAAFGGGSKDKTKTAAPPPVSATNNSSLKQNQKVSQVEAYNLTDTSDNEDNSSMNQFNSQTSDNQELVQSQTQSQVENLGGGGQGNLNNTGLQQSQGPNANNYTSISASDVHFEVGNGLNVKSTNSIGPAYSNVSSGGIRAGPGIINQSQSQYQQPGISPSDCAFNRHYENSKLRQRLEVIESIRGDLQSEQIEVPGVVVVGNQSAGKSSVLESISGINFPRGENTCTRCASIVRLECDTSISEPYALISTQPNQQQQQRNHNGNHNDVIKVTDFTMIGHHIDALTQKLGGPNQGTILLDDVIYITVKNRSGPTLTLIDLPGLTFVHKTQRNIHDITVELIKRYIKNEQAVILTVIPATEDFGNCEALNLASDFDPHGIRTLGVATKCDMVGHDSDIVQKLTMSRESDIKLKLGFVGVRCRSPAEIKNGVTFGQMAENEKKLFTTNPIYAKNQNQSNNSQQNQIQFTKDHWGMDTLVSRICGVQEQTVSKWVPKVKIQISGLISQKEKELQKWPLSHPDVRSKRKHLQKIVASVMQSFSDLANAKQFREKDLQMNISARVRSTFARMRNSVKRGLPKFLSTDSEREISKLLKETKSHGLPNFVSDSIFEHTIKRSVIPLLATHAKHLIREISEYMNTVVNVLIQENSKTYPGLTAELEQIANSCIEKQTEKSGMYVAEYYESEEMIYASDDERYSEILNEVKQAVKQMGPWVAKELSRELQKRDGPGNQNQNSNSTNQNESNSGSDGPNPPNFSRSNNSSNDKVNTVLESLSILERRVPHQILHAVAKYGVTPNDLIRLGADEANAIDNASGPGGPGSQQVQQTQGSISNPNLGLNGSGSNINVIHGTDSLHLSMARETQFSLLAYGHIVQGRFTDLCCLVTYKLLVKDLQTVLQESFHEVAFDNERLDLLMENDPETVAQRTELEKSLKRLSESLRRLNKCD